MTKPSLMIFAAGFGTRMGELTAETPKPMLSLAGRPMIEQSIALANSFGTPQVFANTHYLSHKIEPYLLEKNVEVHEEKGCILDTGGGLKVIAKHLSSPTFTLNPDVFWTGGNPLEVLYDQWEDRLDALLLVVPAKRARGRDKGDFSVSEGQARRGGDLVYTGAQMIRPERAMEIDEEVFSLNLVWNRLIARGTLKLCEYPGSWMDIGTPEGLSDANAMAATKSG